MKLWYVTNGWCGNSEVRCYVIAPDDVTAIELARPAYKKTAGTNYPDSYWQTLTAQELCADTSVAWVGEVSDG